MQRINRKRNIRNLFAAPEATKKDLTKNTRISAEQQKQMHKLQLAAECDGDGNSDAGWGRQVKGADETRLCLCQCMSALPACLPTPTKGSYKFATPSSISLLCVCVCVWNGEMWNVERGTCQLWYGKQTENGCALLLSVSLSFCLPHWLGR